MNKELGEVARCFVPKEKKKKMESGLELVTRLLRKKQNITCSIVVHFQKFQVK